MTTPHRPRRRGPGFSAAQLEEVARLSATLAGCICEFEVTARGRVHVVLDVAHDEGCPAAGHVSAAVVPRPDRATRRRRP